MCSIWALTLAADTAATTLSSDMRDPRYSHSTAAQAPCARQGPSAGASCGKVRAVSRAAAPTPRSDEANGASFGKDRGGRGLRPHHAADRARRAARHPERDGGGDRAHGHVAVHPREEGLLCRPVRRRRPADRRLQPAGVRRRGRARSPSTTRSTPCAPATSTGSTTATPPRAPSRTRPTRCSWRPCSRKASSSPSRSRWAHFNDIGGMRAGLALARLHGHLPGGHHRAAGAGGARGRGRRRAAAAVFPQLALPRDGQGRHARLHGGHPAGRAAAAELFDRFGARARRRCASTR